MSFEHTKLRYNRVPFHRIEGEKILQQVEAHWERLRSSDPVPGHTDVAGKVYDEMMAHCFVLERVAPTIARFRVAGANVTELMGMDARGMPLSVVFSAEGRDELAGIIQTVCDGPEVVEIPVTAAKGLRRAGLRGRVLLLPLRDRDGKVTRIFGAVVFDGSVGRNTVRLDIDRSVPLRCKRLTPTIRTISEMNDTTPGVTPEPTVTTITQAMAPLPARSARSYLQLVVDNT
ncbi:MAG: PAS domain-containing protein [Pseudomonadota bacterium]